MASWNGSFDGVDPSDPSLWSMFRDAILERCLSVRALGDAHPNEGYGGLLDGTIMGVGDDAQKGDYSTNYYLVAEKATVEWMQLAVDGLVRVFNWWNPHAPDPDGSPDALNFALDASGTLSPTVIPTISGVWTYASLATYLGYDPNGFRRKTPRQVGSPSAQIDFDGNPAAVGQVAFLNDQYEGPFYPATSVCKVVVCTVVAANPFAGIVAGFYWVPIDESGHVPDLLDSHAASPNKASILLRNNSGPGDYIGPWIFTELRDFLNQLTEVFFTDQGHVGSPVAIAMSIRSKFVNGFGGSGSSMAAAIAAAEAAYVAPKTAALAGDWNYGMYAYNGSNTGLNGPNSSGQWAADIFGELLQIIAPATLFTGSHTTDIYYRAGAPLEQTSGPGYSAPASVFDNCGHAFCVYNVWKKGITVNDTGSTTQTLEVDNLTTHAPWGTTGGGISAIYGGSMWSYNGNTDGQHTLDGSGFDSWNIAAIRKHDFQYTSST